MSSGAVGGGVKTCVHSHGVAIAMGSLKCIWYNDKRLWSGTYTYGYKWGFSILATGKMAYSSQNKTFYLELDLLH